MAGLAHLCCNGEEGGSTSVREHDGTNGGDGVGEAGVTNDLVVGNPDGIFGCGTGAILNTDSDGDDED